MKTLKDLWAADEFDRHKFSVRNGYKKLYSEDVLRNAAIEWLKCPDIFGAFLNSMTQEEHHGFLEKTQGDDFLIIDEFFNWWIKYFFGIKEEDLR